SHSYDYGPLGVILKNNIKKIWQTIFVDQDFWSYLYEARMLLNPQVWVASKHIDKFIDYFVTNLNNKKRYRLDHLLNTYYPDLVFDSSKIEDYYPYLDKIKRVDNTKTSWSKIQCFNLLFQTNLGIVEDNKTVLHFRPELAQGLIINFKNLLKINGNKLPLAIAQIGHSFRNEITPKNFIFRTREFEQMEVECFVKKTDEDKYFDYYLEKMVLLLKNLGFDSNSYRLTNIEKNDLAHYAKKVVDIEFNFSFGWGELMGLANRGTFDLSNHALYSKKDLSFLDSQTQEKIIPSIIEPSIGLDRLMLAVLDHHFFLEELESGKTRHLLKLNLRSCPYQIAVLPLIKEVHNERALCVYNLLKKHNFRITFQNSGTIGKRYRKQDALGTYYCLTIDDQSLEDNNNQNLNEININLRNRDSMKQIKLTLNELINDFYKLDERFN
ncbi:MAG: glycine--tRNA ligase, partial [Mycoplasma sp.]|nr:glycine--tRNA ligase [Mycoplasma sp.]